LLVTIDVIPSSQILATLMMEALRSSETSVLTRATRRNAKEDGITHRHRRENLNSYTECIEPNRTSNSSEIGYVESISPNCEPEH
jgi:hypothetical protein